MSIFENLMINVITWRWTKVYHITTMITSFIQNSRNIYENMIRYSLYTTIKKDMDLNIYEIIIANRWFISIIIFHPYHYTILQFNCPWWNSNGCRIPAAEPYETQIETSCSCIIVILLQTLFMLSLTQLIDCLRKYHLEGVIV